MRRSTFRTLGIVVVISSCASEQTSLRKNGNVAADTAAEADLTGSNASIAGAFDDEEVESVPQVDPSERVDVPAGGLRLSSGASARGGKVVTVPTPKYRDQGARGTCAAFASMSMLEIWTKKLFNADVDFSREQTWHYNNKTTKFQGGSNFSDHLGSTATSCGIVTEDKWPYSKAPVSAPFYSLAGGKTIPKAQWDTRVVGKQACVSSLSAMQLKAGSTTKQPKSYYVLKTMKEIVATLEKGNPIGFSVAMNLDFGNQRFATRVVKAGGPRRRSDDGHAYHAMVITGIGRLRDFIAQGAASGLDNVQFVERTVEGEQIQVLVEKKYPGSKGREINPNTIVYQLHNSWADTKPMYLEASHCGSKMPSEKYDVPVYKKGADGTYLRDANNKKIPVTYKNDKGQVRLKMQTITVPADTYTCDYVALSPGYIMDFKADRCPAKLNLQDGDDPGSLDLAAPGCDLSAEVPDSGEPSEDFTFDGPVCDAGGGY